MLSQFGKAATRPKDEDCRGESRYPDAQSLKGAIDFEGLAVSLKRYPDKKLTFTAGCLGGSTFQGGMGEACA
jgi:hypothetical protein